MRVSVVDGRTYRVLWSPECLLYRGLCDCEPALSWQADTEDEALDGIRRQVRGRVPSHPNPPEPPLG